jgi:transposase
MKKYGLFIGIDISKLKIDVYVQGEQPIESPHVVFDNNQTGYKSMCRWISKLGSLEESFFCMEHTGIYAIPLCFHLSKQELTYVLVPALTIKKSLGMQRGKSDKADAKAIARYISLFHKEVKQSVLPEKVLMKLRLMLAHRERLLKAKNLFDVPTKELTGFVDDDLAKGIIGQSKVSITLLKKQVKEIEQQMLAIVKADEELNRLYELVISVPGIGPQIALNMLVVTRCFSCFDDARKFACYCGIAPFPYASGSSIKGRTRISHLANKKMKSLLSLGAISSIGHDPQIQLYYQKKLKEGKHHMSIVNSVRNKIVHRVFAIVKRGTPFVKLAKYAA